MSWEDREYILSLIPTSRYRSGLNCSKLISKRKIALFATDYPSPPLSPLEAPLSNFEMLSKDLSRFGIQVRSLQSIISFIDWLPAGLLLSAVRAAHGSLLLAMLSADEQCHVRFTNNLWCLQTHLELHKTCQEYVLF